MNLLLEFAIKISLVVALGLLATALLRRGSAAQRHWMLAASMAAALATPLLMGLAPSWSLPVAAAVDAGRQMPERQARSRGDARIAITTSNQTGPTTTASPERTTDPAPFLLAIWAAGVVLNLAGLVLGFWRLHRIAARAAVIHEGPWVDAARSLSEHFGLRTPVRLLQSDQQALLVTWGLFTPKVMLPADAASWDADRIHVVLAHELAHVHRSDWIIQIGGELLRIAYWFNPLVWFASSRLRLESERACDDAVVNLGVQRPRLCPAPARARPAVRPGPSHLLPRGRDRAAPVEPRTESHCHAESTSQSSSAVSDLAIRNDRWPARHRASDCAVCAEPLLDALRLGHGSVGRITAGRDCRRDRYAPAARAMK